MPACHALLACAAALPVVAQDVTVFTTRGERVEGALRGFAPRGEGDGRLTIAAGGRERTLSLGEILSVHHATPRRAGSVEVHLVGAERLHGDLRAGDAAGETLGLQSPTLGRIAVPIDRLDVLIFRARAGDARVDDFRVPDSIDADEVLFRRAERVGFSRIVGGIHRFRDESVLFDVGSGVPEPFRYDDLVAISLRGGDPRPAPAEALLLTRSGDVVGVDLRGYEDGELRVAIEGGERELALDLADLAVLTPLGQGRRFLSDLPLESVEERAFFEDAGVLLPHARDHSVTGGYLVSGGLAFAKGVGVHSRSVLRWRVPPGVRWFHTHVGLGDEVKELGLRAAVRVAVSLDDEVLWEAEVLRVADGATSPGLLRVAPGKTLALEVDFGPGLDLGDRVGWLGAVFLE